jgi:hypothetical protein
MLMVAESEPPENDAYQLTRPALQDAPHRTRTLSSQGRFQDEPRTGPAVAAPPDRRATPHYSLRAALQHGGNHFGSGASCGGAGLIRIRSDEHRFDLDHGAVDGHSDEPSWPRSVHDPLAADIRMFGIAASDVSASRPTLIV